MNQAKSVFDLLVKHAHKNPYKNSFIFLEDGENAEVILTYKELLDKATLVAEHLKEDGFHQKPVLLLYPSGIDFIVSFFACQINGSIAVPLYPPRGNNHWERLELIANDCNAAAILTSQSYVSTLRKGFKAFFENDGKVISTDELNPLDNAVEFNPSKLNNISFIQYTSGSTGNPKGVVVTNENLLHNEGLLAGAFKQTETSVLCSWLPFYHDMGLIGNIIHSIYVGATCVLFSPFHFIQKPIRWLNAISKYRVTFSGAPNFAYDLCSEKIKEEDLNTLDLSCLEFAYNGAEVVRSSTLERFYEKFRKCGFDKKAMYPCYGLAEATLFVSGGYSGDAFYQLTVDRKKIEEGIFLLTRDEEEGKKIVASGFVRPGMHLKIFNPQNSNVCRETEIGEICIAGKSVSSGYWNKIYKKENYFEDPETGMAYLRTGDLGILYNEQLFVTGRVKELLIQRGKNYYPYDIEFVASNAHKALAANSCAAFSVEQNLEEKIILCLEVKREFYRNIPEQEIYSSIKRALVNTVGIEVDDIVLIKPMSLPKNFQWKNKEEFMC